MGEVYPHLLHPHHPDQHPQDQSSASGGLSWLHGPINKYIKCSMLPSGINTQHIHVQSSYSLTFNLSLEETSLCVPLKRRRHTETPSQDPTGTSSV